MATHHENATITGPFSAAAPVERLLAFYTANGYEVVGQPIAGEQSAGGADENPADKDCGDEGLVVERGRAGTGWWTSNMTQLHTVVDIEYRDDTVNVCYEVNTTGQILDEVEQSFWRRELQYARRFVTGEDSAPRDLRPEEAHRADQKTSSIRSFGIWAAVIIFALIIVLGLVGVI